MDALKQQLLKVQQQLAGLSASQKMLTASLLVIMVMTLFYWSNVAGRTEMEAVIDSPMTTDEMKIVLDAAKAKNVKSEMRDNKVFVPVGQHEQFAAAMSELAYAGTLPAAYNKPDEDTDSGFGFMSDGVRQSKLQEKRRRRVEGMIARFPGVRSVTVILAGEKSTGIMHDNAPTASVSIDTKPNGGADAKKIVDSARKLVLGAQPGIADKDVQVIVNGQSFDANSPDQPFGGSDEQLAVKKQGEADFLLKLKTQLRYIEGVQTSVVVKLNTSSVTTDEHAMDPKNTATAVKTESVTEENTPLPQPNGEPGANANLPVNADPAVVGAEQPAATVNKREKTNQVEMSYKNTLTKSAGGEVSAVTAVVGVPESYFRKVWKARNADAKREPKDDEVRAVIAAAMPDIRETARLAVNIQDPKNVQVSTYFDLDDATLVADPTAGAGLAALPTGSGFGAKEIAVGALAVISLFMVSMMVRKSAPQPVLAAAGMAVGPSSATEAMPEHNALLTVGDVIGEVSESTMTMAGHELSPDEINAKQVIEQVGTMVKANPDIAANLVKRWLNQD